MSAQLPMTGIRVADFSWSVPARFSPTRWPTTAPTWLRSNRAPALTDPLDGPVP